MSDKSLTKTSSLGEIEKVLIQGDLSGLTEPQRVNYVKSVCDSMGLNMLTKPFEFIRLNGKLVLYATRSCADQLRKVNRVSTTITGREIISDIYVVTARGTLPDGREDEATGAVTIKGLSGEALANAMLKAETKAKRRMTLSICGLGLLDEVEIGDTTNNHREARSAITQRIVEETSSRPEFETIITEQSVTDTIGDEDLGSYIFKTGNASRKGKPIKDLKRDYLTELLAWYHEECGKGKTFGADVDEDFFFVAEFLKTAQS